MTDHVAYLNPPSARELPGLYSHVTRVKPGELIFLAGQVAADRSGAVIGAGDLAAQFAAILDAIGAILGDLETDFDSIVKFTTYLIDAKDIPEFNGARNTLFPRLFAGPLYPPNTLLIVDGLAKPEYLIEIDAVACVAG